MNPKDAACVNSKYEARNPKHFFISTLLMMRIKICRKEAKESNYWLKISILPKNQEENKSALLCESEELIIIFAAIMRKVRV
jgi:hypothetical protein